MTPYQKEVQQRADRILNMPGGIRHGVINEFRDMAEGGTAYGIRAAYYGDKTDQFFKDVLEIIQRHHTSKSG